MKNSFLSTRVTNPAPVPILPPKQEEKVDTTDKFKQKRKELKKLREALLESELDDDNANPMRHGDDTSLSSASSVGGKAFSLSEDTNTLKCWQNPCTSEISSMQFSSIGETTRNILKNSIYHDLLSFWKQ
jgi:hypothetical protein